MPADLLKTRTGRRVLFGALYFSEGAPIGFIWWAMPTKLSSAGMPLERVGLIMSLLVLPWALKFLWAPLIDALRGPRWGLRAWIVTAQLLMGLSLAPLLVLPLHEHLRLITALLVAHALFAATQDVAIDALCVASVPVHERGSVNGWMQTGMLAARGTFGGLALVAEGGITKLAEAGTFGQLDVPQQLGQAVVIAALITCVWCSGALLWFVREPAAAHAARNLAARFRVFGRTIIKAGSRRGTWLGLAFAAAGGAAFEAAGGLAGPLLKSAGATPEQIGYFYAFPVIACTVGGALAGGWVCDRAGRRRTTAVAVSAIALLTVAIGLAQSAHAPDPDAQEAATQTAAGQDDAAVRGEDRQVDDTGDKIDDADDRPPPYSIFTLFALLYVCIGVFTAASYAMFMDLTDPDIAGTQFSAFMGATNLCESWSVVAASRLIGALGPIAGLGIMAGASLATLPLLARIPSSRTREDHVGPPPG